MAYEMGIKGREKVNKFSDKKHADNLLKIYEKLIN